MLARFLGSLKYSKGTNRTISEKEVYLKATSIFLLSDQNQSYQSRKYLEEKKDAQIKHHTRYLLDQKRVRYRI